MEIAQHVARFHEFLSNGHRDRALLEIAQGRDAAPSASGVWLFLTGLFLLREGFSGRALRSMEEAFRLEPQSREFLYGVALSNSALGFYQEVLFCAKLSSSTHELAPERGWGDLLTTEMRNVDRLLMAVDENSVLLRVRDRESHGDYLAAARIAEDGLLAFEQNHSWRRAAISCYLSANRPFSAASLLDVFANRAELSLSDQVLVGEVFASLGRTDESLIWFSNVASQAKEHRANRVAFTREFVCHRPPLPQGLLAVGDKIVKGLIPRSRLRGRGCEQSTQRLRIGIVSADLLIGGLIERVALLFEMFSKSNIEFYLYIDSPLQDSLTERFIALSKDYYVTHGIDDMTFAHILREDEIDVMLELDSLGIYRRPNVARLQPASLHVVAFGDPQEAHRWGYDAVLSDPFLSPPCAGNGDGGKPRAISSSVESVIDDSTPCPILRPHAGFLQVADIFEVQALAVSRRRNLRVGISATYASFDAVSRAFLVRSLLQIPCFELILDSESLGGEQASATLLMELESDLPRKEQKRIRVLPEHSPISTFLSRIDIFLDIGFPRSAYMFWQALRHGVPALTLSGDTVASRLSLSVARQMSIGDFCICDDSEMLLSRLGKFCLESAHRSRFRQALRRKVSARARQKEISEKALSVARALFEGVCVLGKTGRYASPRWKLD